MHWYLSADIICSEKRTVFRERNSRKTVRFEARKYARIFVRGHYPFREANKDKYPNIFSPQMENTVFIILQIFLTTRAVLKIGEYLTIIPRARVGYEMIDSQRVT